MNTWHGDQGPCQEMNFGVSDPTFREVLVETTTGLRVRPSKGEESDCHRGFVGMLPTRETDLVGGGEMYGGPSGGP